MGRLEEHLPNTLPSNISDALKEFRRAHKKKPEGSKTAISSESPSKSLVPPPLSSNERKDLHTRYGVIFSWCNDAGKELAVKNYQVQVARNKRLWVTIAAGRNQDPVVITTAQAVDGKKARFNHNLSEGSRYYKWDHNEKKFEEQPSIIKKIDDRGNRVRDGLPVDAAVSPHISSHAATNNATNASGTVSADVSASIAANSVDGTIKTGIDPTAFDSDATLMGKGVILTKKRSLESSGKQAKLMLTLQNADL